MEIGNTDSASHLGKLNPKNIFVVTANLEIPVVGLIRLGDEIKVWVIEVECFRVYFPFFCNIEVYLYRLDQKHFYMLND